jgi:putative ATPase
MLILACEDVGLADPAALGVVMDAAQAFDYVGLPEGRYHLAHACLYLATAPKSNSSMAFFDAIKTVSEEAADDVPGHLRDGSRDSEGFGHGEGYLYPHAYRDHWVAQQYLPDTLQGKLFYQPSEQGFERSISERVARQREAQLAAMIEDEESTPLGNGENKPSETGSRRWMERTLSARGEQLGRVRERLIELAEISRSGLVLDLCGRSGLLAFEALRRAPEGGVWVLAHDDRASATLQAMAKTLGPLSRPQIVRTDLAGFDRDLAAAAGGKVRFDAVIGRNILTREKNKCALIERILKFLRPQGILALAEIVPSEGQRISALTEPWDMDPHAKKILANAEASLFSDADDAMVSWTSASLEKELAAVQRATVTVSAQSDAPARRIPPPEIDFWFRTTDRTGRLSLGDRILEQSSEPELLLIKDFLHRKLDYQEVCWKTVIAFIKITAQENTDTK